VTKTETKRRIKTPARTVERVIPAVTKQVTRRVVKTPAQTQERVIPAVTKQVTRRVVDAAPRTERREIPARYETVTVQKMVEAPRTDRVDGRLGQQTYYAVEQFQRARGLSTGGLTLSTVDALGVDWRSMVGGTSSITGTTSGGSFSGSTGGSFSSGTVVGGW